MNTVIYFQGPGSWTILHKGQVQAAFPSPLGLLPRALQGTDPDPHPRVHTDRPPGPDQTVHVPGGSRPCHSG